MLISSPSGCRKLFQPVLTHVFFKLRFSAHGPYWLIMLLNFFYRIISNFFNPMNFSYQNDSLGIASPSAD